MKFPVKLKIYDFVAFFLSLAVFIAFTIFGWHQGGEGGYLLVKDREGESLYPMSEDRRITIYGPAGESVIEISQGQAAFIHSDCPDEICVQSGKVTDSGDWAACLPNEVIITVRGGEEGLDDIVF